MKKQIQRITMMIIFTLCVSLSAIAQIKIGPTKAPGDVKTNPDLYQSVGNTMSGVIKVYKGYLSCLDPAQILVALQLTAKEVSPEGKAVGKIEIGALRDTGEFYECPYKITRLPADQQIKIDLAFRAPKCSNAVSTYIFERKKQALNRGESEWDSTINFPSQAMTGKFTTSYNFGVFAKILP